MILSCFKQSKVRWTKKRSGLTDSGYTGIKKLQKIPDYGELVRRKKSID